MLQESIWSRTLPFMGWKTIQLLCSTGLREPQLPKPARADSHSPLHHFLPLPELNHVPPTGKQLPITYSQQLQTTDDPLKHCNICFATIKYYCIICNICKKDNFVNKFNTTIFEDLQVDAWTSFFSGIKHVTFC